ncbi:diguanylate cyclase domain-containing protein [Actinoplanes sp. NPDC049681]|uniref:diguanylate cyclase domain-containing protein n=1 Tax=Actinoplanes sp. NPDC049681 TaxID=3363905 RepID=UPI0037B22B8F
MIKAVIRTVSGVRGNPWRLVAGGLCLVYLVPVVRVIIGRDGGTPPELIVGPFLLGYTVLAAVLAGCAATRSGLDRRTRAAWGLTAVSFAMLGAATVGFQVSGTRFPSVGDAVRLAFVPVMLAGLLLFPLRARTARQGRKLLMDVATVLAGGFVVMWQFTLGPALAARGVPAHVTLVAVAYPVGDLALAFGAAVVLLRGASATLRRPLTMLATAMGLFIVGDAYLGYSRSAHAVQHYQYWQFICWLTAYLLMALAAVEQCHTAGRHRVVATGQGRSPSVAAMPYAAVGVSYLIMILVAVRQPLYPWGGLVLGSMMITGLVVLRQVVALRENHALATSDSMTGLANRARLRDELGLALARSQRSGHPVAVLLIDMNGFKQINDTLGHEAGDELLSAYAALLRRCVLGSDTVSRLGGDEFAIALGGPGTEEKAHAVAERILSEMRNPVLVAGVPMQPQASIGIAISLPGTDTVNGLLHRADLAMYEAKRSGASTWRQYDGETVQAA